MQAKRKEAQDNKAKTPATAPFKSVFGAPAAAVHEKSNLAPVDGSSYVWRCTACGKVKDLHGDHLRGKVEVRSDCWPCAKKSTFRLDKAGADVCCASEATGRIDGHPSHSTGEPAGLIDGFRSPCIPDEVDEEHFLLQTQSEGKRGETPASEASPVWRCRTCGKIKQLSGDHLKGKTEVRSDCWPCGKKCTFYLATNPGSSTPSAGLSTVPPCISVATGEARGDTPRTSALKASGQSDAKTPATAPFKSVFGAPAAADAKTPATAPFNSVFGAPAAADAKTPATAPFKSVFGAPAAADAKTPATAPFKSVFGAPAAADAKTPATAPFKSVFGAPAAADAKTPAAAPFKSVFGAPAAADAKTPATAPFKSVFGAPAAADAKTPAAAPFKSVFGAPAAADAKTPATAPFKSVFGAPAAADAKTPAAAPFKSVFGVPAAADAKTPATAPFKSVFGVPAAADAKTPATAPFKSVFGAPAAAVHEKSNLAPVDGSSYVWRCTACGKVKDLHGDHLRGKVEVRSDCWPCAKKSTFRLDKAGADVCCASEATGRIDGHPSHSTGEPAGLIDGFRSPCIPDEVDEERFLLQTQSEGKRGETPASEASPVWRCRTCGKIKQLSGDHLKGKTEVRSDCWPCGKKCTFYLATNPGSSTPSAGLSTVPPCISVATGEARGDTPRTSALKASGQSDAKTPATAPFKSVFGAPAAADAKTPAAAPFKSVFGAPAAADAKTPATAPFKSVFGAPAAADAKTPATAPFKSVFGAPAAADAKTPAAAPFKSVFGAPAAAVHEKSNLAPVDGSSYVWRCTACGKVKDLHGDHLRGKVEVRSDCWPCAKKSTFRLDKAGADVCCASEATGRIDGHPSHSTGEPAGLIDGFRSPCIPDEVDEEHFLLQTQSEGKRGETPASEASPVWRCRTCGKIKQLSGDHLKGKTEVRSDCWPCGKKCTFYLATNPGSSTPSAGLSTVPPCISVATGEARGDTPRTSALKASGQSDAKTPVTAPFKSVFGAPAAADAKTPAAAFLTYVPVCTSEDSKMPVDQCLFNLGVECSSLCNNFSAPVDKLRCDCPIPDSKSSWRSVSSQSSDFLAIGDCACKMPSSIKNDQCCLSAKTRLIPDSCNSTSVVRDEALINHENDVGCCGCSCQGAVAHPDFSDVVVMIQRAFRDIKNELVEMKKEFSALSATFTSVAELASSVTRVSEKSNIHLTLGRNDQYTGKGVALRAHLANAFRKPR